MVFQFFGCYDLAKGYFMYSLVMLDYKLITIAYICYFLPSMIETSDRMIIPYCMAIGYLILTSVCLILTIIGAIKKRSSLMTPQTFVLICENLFIFGTIVALLLHKTDIIWIVIGTSFINVLHAYILSAHITLRNKIKNEESSNSEIIAN